MTCNIRKSIIIFWYPHSAEILHKWHTAYLHLSLYFDIDKSQCFKGWFHRYWSGTKFYRVVLLILVRANALQGGFIDIGQGQCFTGWFNGYWSGPMFYRVVSWILLIANIIQDGFVDIGHDQCFTEWFHGYWSGPMFYGVISWIFFLLFLRFFYYI